MATQAIALGGPAAAREPAARSGEGERGRFGRLAIAYSVNALGNWRAAAPEAHSGAADLHRANSVLNGGMTGAAVAGPALAGVLLAAWGAGWTLALDALSFALAAGLLWTVPAPRADAGSPGWRERLAE